MNKNTKANVNIIYVYYINDKIYSYYKIYIYVETVQYLTEEISTEIAVFVLGICNGTHIQA